MPARQPFDWTQDRDQKLRELAAAGTSVRAMAEEVGTSKSAVDRRLKHLGVTIDRSATAAASQANALDAKARRARLALVLLEDAERMREQLWQPCVAFNFGGRDNTYNEHPLARPVFADQLKIMQTVGAAVDRALKLDLHDAAAGAAQVVGLLQATAASLGLTDQQDTQP